MKDRRTARRYDLFLPVFIRVLIEKGTVSRTGKTRDISTGGIYFNIDNDLSAGTELSLKVGLPVEVTGGTEVVLTATGKVVRMDKCSGNSDELVGVAAMFERREIVRNKATIA